MKFTSILFAAFGLSTFVAALPAPAPEAGLEISEKRWLAEREAVPALEERGQVCAIDIDVNACITAIVAINKKYSAVKPCTSDVIKSWSAAVVAEIKILIKAISACPAGCTFPDIDVCVKVFVNLLVCIFVQLKIFVGLAGLILTLLLTVDILLSILLGCAGDLLHILVQLFLLIEVKIKVGICELIIKGCLGLVDYLYLSVLVKLCVAAGLSLHL